MTTGKHTRWAISKLATPEYRPEFGIYEEGNPRDLARVYNDNAESNAEFIVRACNCHEELLEALKGIAGICKVTTAGPFMADIERIAKTAIAKAEGRGE